MTSASAWENRSALGGTRTPNLLIRRFQSSCPDPFRWVRDLRLVSSGRPRGSESYRGCSSVWLPAWLPRPNRTAGDPLLRRSVCAADQACLYAREPAYRAVRK